MILLTKLRPPAAREATLRRGELLGRLDAAAGCRWVLVAGPAGSGKTTLLASWSAEQAVTRPCGCSQATRAGRHIGAAALGNRLRALGIEPQRTRLAALDQLTKEVPPALLAGVLGIHTSSVAATTNRSGGDWARYAGRN